MEGLSSLCWKKNPVNSFKIITIFTLHNTVISLSKNISTILLDDIDRVYQINPFSLQSNYHKMQLLPIGNNSKFRWWWLLCLMGARAAQCGIKEFTKRFQITIGSEWPQNHVSSDNWSKNSYNSNSFCVAFYPIYFCIPNFIKIG